MRNKITHLASAGVIVATGSFATGAYHHQLQVYAQRKQAYEYAQQQKAAQARLEAQRKAVIESQLKNVQVVNGKAVTPAPPATSVKK